MGSRPSWAPPRRARCCGRGRRARMTHAVEEHQQSSTQTATNHVSYVGSGVRRFRALHRWGGASFEQNQPRQICVNPCDQESGKKVRSIRRSQQ
eukprot:5139224-Pyramimonas_sp.AAC.1